MPSSRANAKRKGGGDGMISRLAESTTNTLKSQQYFKDMYSIVKELVENALDANASTIKVFVDASIVVEDDGEGVDCLDLVGYERCTSKFDETYRVVGYRDDSTGGFSYGFRGQALCALKDVADVTILTNRACVTGASHDILLTSVGTDSPAEPRNKALVKDLGTDTVKAAVRERGTTVTVANIFKKLPVRKGLLNFAKEMPRIVQLFHAYVLVNNVKLSLMHANKQLFSRSGNTGPLYMMQMTRPLKTFHERKTTLLDLVLCDDAGHERFIFYKKRLVASAVLSRTVQDAYALFRSGCASFVLVINGACDINLSPDKTEILMADHDQIIGDLKRAVCECLSESLAANTQGRATEPVARQKKSIGDTQLEHSSSEGSTFTQSIGSRDILGTPLRPFFQSQSMPLMPRPPEPLYAKSTASPKRRMVLGKTDASTDPTCTENVSRESVFEYFTAPAPAEVHTRIEKSDFLRMKVVGQFNSGFILCTLASPAGTLLLIVDQHASDEIGNFEKMLNSHHLDRQLLISPIELDLSPVETFILENNAQVFHKNGFVVEGGKLRTVPVYDGSVFGIADFRDLMENIKSGNTCFDRLREIMASKACRMSIMIGDVLDDRRMCSLVRGLGRLKVPWRCPHGRPVFKVLDIL